MKYNPSPRELADEALAELRAAPLSPSEGFEFLVRQGIIDRSGRVLVGKLFGTETPQEAAGSPACADISSKNGAYTIVRKSNLPQK